MIFVFIIRGKSKNKMTDLKYTLCRVLKSECIKNLVHKKTIIELGWNTQYFESSCFIKPYSYIGFHRHNIQPYSP